MNNKISFKVQTFDKMKSNIGQEISLGLTFFIYFQTGLLLQYMSISQSILYCLTCLADKAENSNLNLALFTSLRIWAIFFVISASNCSNCSQNDTKKGWELLLTFWNGQWRYNKKIRVYSKNFKSYFRIVSFLL